MLKKLRSLIPIFPTYRQVLEARQRALSREVVELALENIRICHRMAMLDEQRQFIIETLSTLPE